MNIISANIVTAFGANTVGTKVTNAPAFSAVVEKAVEQFDFESQTVPGQGFILVPEAMPYVSAGVGVTKPMACDYVCREHRGVVSAYLKREFAAPVTGCAVVVYTLAAYLADPDVTAEEAARVAEATHVLVAVLAFAGPQAQLSPMRFVHNLAGGNNEALVWTADEIREKAKAVQAYEAEWAVVAD